MVESMQTKNEFSAGAVIFRMDGPTPLYLLLHYYFKGNYWDFSRGNLESGENEMEAASREIREETGLTAGDLSFIAGFKETVQWFYTWQNVRRTKRVTYFLAESRKAEVQVSHEHSEYKWLPFADALRQMSYDNSKSVLRKADAFLRKNPNIRSFLTKP
jgi:bis(5'-nucleosidyl)-tetraphosphatase